MKVPRQIEHNPLKKSKEEERTSQPNNIFLLSEKFSLTRRNPNSRTGLDMCPEGTDAPA